MYDRSLTSIGGFLKAPYDIAAISQINNLLVKYADEITVSVLVRQSADTAATQV